MGYSRDAMVSFEARRFDELGGDVVYEVLALRQLVFVVEQACVYLDCDGLDRDALHVLGRAAGGELVAYARILPPGRAFPEAAIGRVVTHPLARRLGLGRAVVERAIAILEADGPRAIRIGAQRYLERFYRELGFEVASEPYVEDGIPHVEMLRVSAPGTAPAR